jgi:hypothetical protein
MCVIFVAKDTRPTDEMVEKAWKKNDDGFGIAWRERVKGRDGKTTLQVRWDKGIEDVELAKKYCREKPLPFIAHFRIASCGGIRPELTHPFAVDETVPELLNGQTGGYVLFHNGHWAKWGDYSMDMTIHLKTKVPKGAWSDSRAMAWAAAHYGNEVLNFIGEKCVVFSPTDLEVFRKDWEMIDGVLCSNNYFQTGTQGYYGNYRQRTMCKFGTCTREDITDGFCPVHVPKKAPLVVVGTLPEEFEDADLPVVRTGELGTGGSSTVDPFAFLDRMLAEKRLSKNRYKKMRKKLAQDMLKQIPPVVVTH